MQSMGSAVSSAMETVRASRAAPSAPVEHLPAMRADEAATIVARPPSAALEVAVARAALEPTLTYVAINGETVTMKRDPLRVDQETSAEAARRLAAIDAMLAQRPEPKAVVRWLYELVDLVERPPIGDAMDNAVKALARALDSTHPPRAAYRDWVEPVF